MKKENKPKTILLLASCVLALLAICNLIMAKSGKNNKEQEKTFSDDYGDFTIESLFEASKETLFYAGKLQIYGEAEYITVCDDGFEKKFADISYTRDYVDNDNYLGHTAVSLHNRTNIIARLNDLWKCDYDYYLGKREGYVFEKLIVGDREDDIIVSSPDIESIIFPDLGNVKTSFHTDKMSDYTGTDVDAYVVTLSGDLSQIGDAARSIVSNVESPFKAEYYFDIETHVLNHIYIESNHVSSLDKTGDNNSSFTLRLYVEKCSDRDEEDDIYYPDSYFEDRVFNFIVSDLRCLELNGSIMASGNIFDPDGTGDYWSQNVNNMWHEITDNGSAAFVLSAFYNRAVWVAQEYGYSKVKVSYGVMNDPDFKHTTLIRVDFYSDEHGNGTIIFPQIITDNRLRSGTSLASLGGDELNVMGNYFVLTRDNSDTNSERLIGTFSESNGFNYIAYELYENPISGLERSNEDLERFPYDLRSKLLGVISSDEYRDDVKISYHRFFDPLYVRYREPSKELYIVTPSDEESYDKKDALTETINCLKTFGIDAEHEPGLKYEYENRDIDTGLEQDKTYWVEVKFD